VHVYYLWKKTDQYATITGKPYNFRRQTLQLPRFLLSRSVLYIRNMSMLMNGHDNDPESSGSAVCMAGYMILVSLVQFSSQIARVVVGIGKNNFSLPCRRDLVDVEGLGYNIFNRPAHPVISP